MCPGRVRIKAVSGLFHPNRRPDRNLATYVAARTETEVIPVPPLGCCPTHQALSVRDVEDLIRVHPDAEVMVHPETAPAVQALASLAGFRPGQRSSLEPVRKLA